MAMKGSAERSAEGMQRAMLDPREDDYVYYVSRLPNVPPNVSMEAVVKRGDTVGGCDQESRCGVLLEAVRHILVPSPLQTYFEQATH